MLCNSRDHHFLGIHVTASPGVMQDDSDGLICHRGLLPILIFEKLRNFLKISTFYKYWKFIQNIYTTVLAKENM